jgi:hypothetical protein
MASADPSADEGVLVNEPLDLERARLLLVWLQSRRALDHALSELLAAGPAGERRVRDRLDVIEDLERKAHNAFAAYRSSARSQNQSRQDASVTVIHGLRANGTDST